VYTDVPDEHGKPIFVVVKPCYGAIMLSRRAPSPTLL